MYRSNIMGKISKDNPKEVDVLSQQIILRSGLFQLSSANNIITMPLGNKLLGNLIDQILDVYDSNQLISLGENLENCLENADNTLLSLIKSEFNSHKSIPATFHIFEDIINQDFILSRGMLSPRNETMLHVVQVEEEDNQSELESLLERFNMPVVLIEGVRPSYYSDNCTEMIIQNEAGADNYLACKCGYVAKKEIAIFDKNIKSEEKEFEIEKVETPNCRTIEEVANYLEVDTSQTAKAVFYSTPEKNKDKLVFVVIRGDLEVNEHLLKQSLKIKELDVAHPDMIAEVGASPGYASPIGIDRENCIVVVDDSISQSSNLVAGANEDGFHFINVNYNRDFKADIVTNIAQAGKGNACNNCSSPLGVKKGASVVKSYLLNYPKLQYIGKDGKPSELRVNIHTFRLHTLIGAILGSNFDDDGLIIPKELSPLDGVVISSVKSDKGKNLLDEIINKLDEMGLEMLVDDAKGKLGMKFKDADMQGFPIRILITDKLAEEQKFELKFRNNPEKFILKHDELHDKINEFYG